MSHGEATLPAFLFSFISSQSPSLPPPQNTPASGPLHKLECSFSYSHGYLTRNCRSLLKRQLHKAYPDHSTQNHNPQPHTHSSSPFLAPCFSIALIPHAILTINLIYPLCIPSLPTRMYALESGILMCFVHISILVLC